MKIISNQNNIDNDITDEEWENLHIPYDKNLNNFMTKYIVSEVVAFSIANSYYRNCLCSASFLQHYNSMKDIVLVNPKFEEIKGKIEELLNIKYNIKIVNESPLILDKWE